MSLKTDSLQLDLPSQRCQVLDAGQYRKCHVQLPEEAKPSAALAVDGQFYSFDRVIPDPQKLKQVVNRLLDKGRSLVVTLGPKGHAIWILEPTAQLCEVTQVGSYTIVESEREYSACQIRVPDLDKPLTGIVYKQNYYSLLRIVRDHSQAKGLAARLVRKGNNVLVSQHTYGVSVWVLEPDALAL